MNNFLTAQGYKIKSSKVYQDNQSAIRMETNGRNSCTGNSRHVDIRYFFVKDRVDRKEIEISYCPTESMVADFLRNPCRALYFELLDLSSWDTKTYLSFSNIAGLRSVLKKI